MASETVTIVDRSRSNWSQLLRLTKQAIAGVDLSLNLLFSFVVLIAATLTAAWLYGHVGEFPLQNRAEAYMLLATLVGNFTIAGIYIHLGLLGRNWIHLGAVSIVAVITLWIGIGVLVCWVPIFVLLGGALGEVAVGQSVNKLISRALPHQCLPRSIRWLIPCRGFLIGIGLPLLVINLIVFAMSGLARHEFQGNTAPDVMFETAEGDPWRLSDQRGKVVLLEFWAPWCGPCRASLPELKALHDKYYDRGDFLLVGASEENDRKLVADFCREQGISWLQVFLPRQPLAEGVHPDELTRPGIPSAWIIDRDGVIIGTDLRGSAVSETVDQLMQR
jgi:thiol-disulfide isomerase/thioredoxin